MKSELLGFLSRLLHCFFSFFLFFFFFFESLNITGRSEEIFFFFFLQEHVYQEHNQDVTDELLKSVKEQFDMVLLAFPDGLYHHEIEDMVFGVGRFHWVE